jgi:hypothetical protein
MVPVYVKARKAPGIIRTIEVTENDKAIRPPAISA